MINLIVALMLMQTNCGDGLPCGKLPWDIPEFPALSSPTPMPTLAITLTPTPTPDTTLTPIPTATPTSGMLDFTDDLDEALSTLDAVLATPLVLQAPFGINVTAVAPDTLAANVGNIYGNVTYLLNSQSTWGPLWPLMNFLFASSVMYLMTILGNFVAPMAAAGVGMLRKIIQLILDFLPL